jgi:hypothetical protein
MQLVGDGGWNTGRLVVETIHRAPRELRTVGEGSRGTIQTELYVNGNDSNSGVENPFAWSNEVRETQGVHKNDIVGGTRKCPG